MARATRSSHQVLSPQPPPAKPVTKKRKRPSNADSDDQPLSKQLRTDTTINGDSLDTHPDMPLLQNTGQVSITSDDAHAILDILEMLDTQGLLDRVFPLPENTSNPPLSRPKSQTPSYSFRALLKESSQHPLCVLRSAIQHLFPISSHPRSRPSPPAVQQLRFCNLALSLLDQASFHSVPTPLDLESIISPITTDRSSSPNIKQESDDSKPTPFIPAESPHLDRRQQYALMQKLPAGEYWTSLNSSPTPEDNTKPLKDLSTGYAELVTILPSTYNTTDMSSRTHTLGSYMPKKLLASRPKLPQARRLSSGSFLDYGPFASFAPTFDSEGSEVGRAELGEVLWGMEERKKQTAGEAERMAIDDDDAVEDAGEMEGSATADDDMEMGENSGLIQKEKTIQHSIEQSLDGLLPPDEIHNIKSALGSLELEEAVQVLLERNRKALERLEELQVTRLASEDGGTSQVEVGSEEWDTAQGIMDSLILLASLRPRSSKDEHSSLIPPASVLRRLHRTLPLQATSGWLGTLPPSKTTSLRDDSTIYIKPGASIPVPAANPAPAPAANVTTTNPAASQTHPPGFSYPPLGSQPYRGGYTPYKPGQASPFYPGYAQPIQGQGPQQTQGQTQAMNTSYYGSPYNSASGHHQYSYGSSWYNYQGQVQAGAPGTGTSSNGRGTPQPAGVPATNYAGFFNNSALPAQRAVANTVTSSSKPAWTANGSPAGYAPTLPPHLRSTVAQPTTPAGSGHTYYGGYTATPAAR